MEGLGATEHGGHGLDGGTHDVVVGVLLRQGPARGLAVGSQLHRTRALGIEFILHQVRP